MDVLHVPANLFLETGGRRFVEQGFTDGGFVVKAGASDFRVPALRSFLGVFTGRFGSFSLEPLRLRGGCQTVFCGGRFLGGRPEVGFELTDLFFQAFSLGGRIVRLGDGVNLGLDRREPFEAVVTFLLQLLARRFPLPEPFLRGGFLGLGLFQSPFRRRQSRFRLFVRFAAPGGRCDLFFDPCLDRCNPVWGVVAQHSQDSVFASGHAGLELGVARLQFGEVLAGSLERRLLARERSLVRPGERVGFLLLLPGNSECRLGRFELGDRLGRRRRCHELLAHRARLAGNQSLAEMIGLVQTIRAMKCLLSRLEVALGLLGSAPGRLGLFLEPLDLFRLLCDRFALLIAFEPALRHDPASGAQLDGEVTDALQELVELRIVAGGLRILPGSLHGFLLLRLHGLRRFNRPSE